MNWIEMKCAWCGNDFKIKSYEYDRWLKKGREYFFCGRSCVAKKRNSVLKSISIKKICPVCKKEFDSSTHNKAATFCSRSCASKGSITVHRRETARKWGKRNSKNIGTITAIAEGLRVREAWKYKALEKFLEEKKIRYQFEFPCGNWVYDLALIDFKTFIEFDGEYHKTEAQIKKDKEKAIGAKDFGWDVFRIRSKNSTMLNPNLLYDFFREKIMM